MSVDGDDKREKGEEEEFWFLLLIPICRAIPMAAATMVMVTATACCPSSLEKKNTVGCLLVVDTDLIYKRKILMAAG